MEVLCYIPMMTMETLQRLQANLQKAVSIAVKNIDMALSIGGFLAGLWDYFSDKSLDGKIQIRI